jgi:hypothetical protein
MEMGKKLIIYVSIVLFLIVLTFQDASAQTIQYGNFTFNVSVDYFNQDIVFTSQNSTDVVIANYVEHNSSGYIVGKFNKKINEVYFAGYIVPYISMYIAQFIPFNYWSQNVSYLNSIGKYGAVFNIGNNEIGILIESGEKYAHLFEVSTGGNYSGYNLNNYIGRISLNEGIGVYVGGSKIYELFYDSNLNNMMLTEYMRDDLIGTSNPWSLQQFFLQ